MSKTLIPITPTVLMWAMEESGFTPKTLAKDLNLSPDVMAAWLAGSQKPNLTTFRKLVSLLKRSPATFLLPTPPASRGVQVQFRKPHSVSRTELMARERHAIRESRRLQETVSWIMKELGEAAPSVPRQKIQEDVEKIAPDIRHFLTKNLNGSFGANWRTNSDAFKGWRNALHESGILVFRFSLGKEGCAGFSLWDDYAPVIAVNTAWNDAARTFSLIHELGHLLTRTNSACMEHRGSKSLDQDDETERWCERLAAAVLVPRESLLTFLENELSIRRQIDKLDTAKLIANRYKVSLRSSVLRLIELGLASWSLYSEIPPHTDDKAAGGGGKGRVRGEIKEDQYGQRALGFFIRALHHDILDRSAVLDYLDVPDSYLDRIERTND